MGQACQSKHKNQETLEFSDMQTSKYKSEVHYRDRFFLIPLQKLPSKQTQRNTILSKWLHEVVSNSMSVAFNYRREEKMDKQATTIFACQNIIRNLIQMSYKEKVTQIDIAELDKIFSKQILSSIKVKYPMSQQKQNNLSLVKQFDVIDNYDTKENDYIISSNVIFEFRTNKKYEDLIMNFLNELIELPDQQFSRIRYGPKDKLGGEKSENNELTLYQYFEEFMRNLFESVSDYDTMNQSKWSESKETVKSKYREEVQSYTTYQIGRKIPSDTKAFDNEAVRTQEIKVQNSSVLRIMTKWAEELSRKFEDKYYFINMVENPVLINKKQSFSFSLSKKQKIQHRIRLQKEEIEKDMKTILKNHQKIQSEILNDTKNNTNAYIPDIQLQEVYFSGRILSVLQVNLSKYLNRLIHGLVTVSKDMCEQFRMNPPILLFTTFKIGDLIRCRCKSKEKEIVYIYKKLKEISDKNPKFLKIIRVKNRLEEGTRDVMINIRFYEKITAEIQLAIRSESKKYTEDSTEINHSLYELERAKFGPISELCSMLYNMNKDQSKIMQKAINESMKSRKRPFFSDKTFCVFHSFKPYAQPFLCDTCFKLVTSNENIISNEYCPHCMYRECSNCRLNYISQYDLKQRVFETYDLFQNSLQYHPEKEQFKQLKQGIGLYKFSRRRIVTAFKYFDISLTSTLITCRQFSDPVVHKESWAQFCSQYIVWINDKVPEIIFKEYNQVSILQKCYLSGVLQKYCKKQRKKVSLQKCDITEKIFQDKVLVNWSQEYRLKIETLSLQCNKFTDMKQICEIVPNLVELTLDDNEIREIRIPDTMKTLRRLSLKRNKDLQKIDKKIKHPESLQKLIFGWNLLFESSPYQSNEKKMQALRSGIGREIPQGIQIFRNLGQLHVLFNGIRQLPDEITKLKKLTYIDLEGNFFQEFPKQILEIRSLDRIAIGNNFIKSIPAEIQKLQFLRVLLAPKNFLTTIPKQIDNLKRLETLGFEENQIANYHKHDNLPKLIRINVNFNKLTDMQNFQNTNISEFYARNNQIRTIPQKIYSKMQNLLVLELSSNLIRKVPESIWSFKKLQKLILNKCGLENCQFSRQKYPSLKVLQLEDNDLTQISIAIINFPNLEEFCVKGNPIKYICNEMKHLKKLNYMTLDLVSQDRLSLKVLESLKQFSWLTILTSVMIENQRQKLNL